jgi:hypothetical protein
MRKKYSFHIGGEEYIYIFKPYAKPVNKFILATDIKYIKLKYPLGYDDSSIKFLEFSM